MAEAGEAKPITRFNDRLALWVVDHVGSMACAWFFAVIAFLALPDKIHEAFNGGFHLAPLIEWFSQSFLQLVLLAIIMVGQDVKARMLAEQHKAKFSEVDAKLQHSHHLLNMLHRRMD